MTKIRSYVDSALGTAWAPWRGSLDKLQVDGGHQVSPHAQHRVHLQACGLTTQEHFLHCLARVSQL